MASSAAALSRTLREMTCPIVYPFQISVRSGPTGVRPRVGLSPKRPQQDAGMRIDPPPSLACESGTMPAATAAADPPLDPPDESSGFQGFLVGPKSVGSVAGSK